MELDLPASCLSSGFIDPKNSTGDTEWFQQKRWGSLYLSSLFSLGFDFFEASAKENISVRQAFERLVDAICDKMSDSMDTDPSVLGASKTTRLSDTPPLL